MPFSSYCQICAMPMSHICLVPVDHEDDVGGSKMFSIYRVPGDGRAPVLFGPRQEWLTHGVALALEQDHETPLFTGGNVEDGDFKSALREDDDPIDIEDGVGDEFAIVHDACWKLAKQPKYFEERLARISKTTAFQEIATEYHNQYFEFAKLAEKGELWLISDPSSSTDEGRRNQERIRQWLEHGKENKTSADNDKQNSQQNRSAIQPILPPALPEGFDGTTLYQWLGLEPPNGDDDNNNIAEANINRAFKRKRLKLHPNAPNGGDAPQFENVRKAHVILTQHRDDYDNCDFTNDSEALKFAYTWERVGRNLV